MQFSSIFSSTLSKGKGAHNQNCFTFIIHISDTFLQNFMLLVGCAQNLGPFWDGALGVIQ